MSKGGSTKGQVGSIDPIKLFLHFQSTKNYIFTLIKKIHYFDPTRKKITLLSPKFYDFNPTELISWLYPGDEYDQVWYHILNIDLVPLLREAFAVIRNEKCGRGVMLPLISSERSALIFVSQFECRNQPAYRDFSPSVGSDDMDKLHCDYCQ